jgi:chemosensory pili system protein ChpA (sensor histidine kinase/response regulator)
MHILIVDDDEDILETTAELLRMGGFDTTTVRHAGKILPALEAVRPDLLLQDCHMPGLDLVRLIHTVRADPELHALPILLFTASVQAEEFWHVIGANGLLRKPFQAGSLRMAIDALLASARSAIRAAVPPTATTAA